MRDVIGRMRLGMMGGGYAGRYWKDGRGICGTDHLPEIGPVGLPFLDQPPIHEGRETRTANDQRSEKRILIFNLN